jgi:hypothetical protein
MKIIALFSAVATFSVAPGAAYAGDPFERGFNDEMGRIAAHAVVGAVAGLLYGPPPPPPAYAPPPRVAYAPPVVYQPVYVAPVYAYPHPVIVQTYPSHGYSAWKHGRHYRGRH